jgi:hypothetical protein
VAFALTQKEIEEMNAGHTLCGRPFSEPNENYTRTEIGQRQPTGVL